jgi:hypothetical protein
MTKGQTNCTHHFLYKILMRLDAATGKLKERIPWIEGLYCAAHDWRTCPELSSNRSKCRGVRARPAGL